MSRCSHLSLTHWLQRLPLLSCSLVIGTLLAGCQPAEEVKTKAPETAPAGQLQQMAGYAQGTTYHISWWADKPIVTAKLSDDFSHTLAGIDKELSTYRDDSFISQFNHSDSTDWQPASAEFIKLLQLASTIHQQSQGCYDPTVGPLFELWGFQKENFEVPTQAQIEQTLAHVGMDNLQIDADHLKIRKTIPELELDLSSMGEGYTIGKLSEVLEQHGITNYLIEFGGDMKVRGHKPHNQQWRIAIERPTPSKQDRIPYRIMNIEDQSGVTLDTSGTYHRYFDKDGRSYSHIIDPRTGAPVTHNLVSDSIFSNNATAGDAWATAMLCLGPEAGKKVAKQHQLEVFFVQNEQGTLINSKSAALAASQRVSFTDYRPTDAP